MNKFLLFILFFGFHSHIAVAMERDGTRQIDGPIKIDSKANHYSGNTDYAAGLGKTLSEKSNEIFLDTDTFPNLTKNSEKSKKGSAYSGENTGKSDYELIVLPVHNLQKKGCFSRLVQWLCGQSNPNDPQDQDRTLSLSSTAGMRNGATKGTTKVQEKQDYQSLLIGTNDVVRKTKISAFSSNTSIQEGPISDDTDRSAMKLGKLLNFQKSNQQEFNQD